MFDRLTLMAVLVFLLSLHSAAPGLRAEKLPAWEKPLLWKVERAGHPVSHLFGTIHLPDPIFMKFPAPVEAVIASSAAVYTEIEMDIASMVAQSERFLLPEGQVIDEILPKPVLDMLAEEMRAIDPRLDLIPFQRYKPWALLLTIPLVEAQMKHPQCIAMDLRIFQSAALAGKKTGGLETIDEQLGLFDGFSAEEQIRMLALQLDHLRACRKQGRSWTGEMVRAYLARDIAAMESASEDYLEGGGAIAPTAADRALHDRLMADLLTGRNRRMAERIDGLLRKEKVPHFIAAGALHFSGPEGIVALLQKQGWKVTPL